MRAYEQRGIAPQSPGIRIVDKREPASPGKSQQDSKKFVHADFNAPIGASTQAIVNWRNSETGERYTAPSGGYSPKEGTKWEREKPSANAGKNLSPKEAREQRAKQLLKEKADRIAEKQKTKSQTPVSATAPKKEKSGTKTVVEAKAPINAKKEAVLADARKKMGMNEKKRAEFKNRVKESNAKRMAARNKKGQMSGDSASA